MLRSHTTSDSILDMIGGSLILGPSRSNSPDPAPVRGYRAFLFFCPLLDRLGEVFVERRPLIEDRVGPRNIGGGHLAG